MQLRYRWMVTSLVALASFKMAGCGRTVVEDQPFCGQPEVDAVAKIKDATPDVDGSKGNFPGDEPSPGPVPPLPINPDAGCPIIGDNDMQMTFGGPTCNGCVKTNCCEAVTSCMQIVDGGAFLPDGGMTECAARIICLYDNCIGVPDASGCNQACASNFSGATNSLADPAIQCVFGPAINKPTPGTCSYRADGGLLCNPN